MAALLILLLFATTVIANINSPLSHGPWGPTNPVADPKAMVRVVGPNGTQVRITVLTERLLRVEQSSLSLQFEDRKTVAFVNRKLLPVVDFSQSLSEDGCLTITTSCVTLTYQTGQEFTASTLMVQGKMYCPPSSSRMDLSSLKLEKEVKPPKERGICDGSKEDCPRGLPAQRTTSQPDNKSHDKTDWTYHYGTEDPLNLLGTLRTLDRQDNITLNCSELDPDWHCEYGLISLSGYAIVNDTLNHALSDDQDWWDGPNRDQEDFYVFGHGHDYKAALLDFRRVAGAIPLLPRFAMGVWFSRWYDDTSASARNMVQQYEQRTLPLDVFVLDMNWHRKNDWTGYSWDLRLYNTPNDAIAYMKYRGLAVTMNLHDADGINIWEDEYNNLCQALHCDKGARMNFTIVNQTVVYGIEDVVLQPLENEGVDFWWIDWQQGEEGPGSAVGGKQNPTVWTAHIRSTNANRRKAHPQDTTQRNMVLARWGGLGAHRYPVHFSGDVLHVSWDNLAYQPYFSMTATNVGAIWSHDVEGPSEDPELYTRWIQWAVLSGVMRSHDRGESTGSCAANDPPCCHVVVPWDVPPAFAQANFEALRLRGRLVPYLYTAAYKAHQTGRWFIYPMYYIWPELEGAYQTASARPDPKAVYDTQYMLGDDVWVAPVLKPVNKTDGLARLNLWVPPGTWVGYPGGQVVIGAEDGSTSRSFLADLNDIPIFGRAGSIIPSTPIRPGATIGLARQPYTELDWTVFLAHGGPGAGKGILYEDDGLTTAYYTDSQFAITTAEYTISAAANYEIGEMRGKQQQTRWDLEATLRNDNDEPSAAATTLTFTVSTVGHFVSLPSSRVTTIRLMNTFPPTAVKANGVDLKYSRFGGTGTWSYQSQDGAVVIELPSSSPSDGIKVEVDMSEQPGVSVDGFGYKLSRAILAKATLDEIGATPGSRSGKLEPGYILKAASAGSNLEYLAGQSSPLDFADVAKAYEKCLVDALDEIRSLSDGDDDFSGAWFQESVVFDPRRIARAIQLLESAICS